MTQATHPTELMYINGEWVKAARNETFPDVNPWNGEVFCEVAAGTGRDASAAAQAAADAFPVWARTAPAVRRQCLLRAADEMEARRTDIVRALVEETGAAVPWAEFQLQLSPAILREAAAQAYSVVGEVLPADLAGATFLATRNPVGVVAGISPWNAPLILSTRAVAFAIAFGNTVVLKPSEESPVGGGVALARAFAAAGLPAGVFNLVTHAPGAAEEIGDALITHPHVRRLNFTGSTTTGRKINEKAARLFKRVLLELGGKAPLLVLRDADLDYAASAAAFGAFLHQGQICMSIERIIVEEPVADAFVERFVAKARAMTAGDPRLATTVIGPLINKRALDRVVAHVEDAVAKGARVRAGGRSRGLCHEATVLTDVTPDMRVYKEETFGPVAPVVVVRDVDEAVRVANDTPYGLSAGVITRDLGLGLAVAERIESGIVRVNDQSIHDEPHVPFGGVKDSGVGRFGGRPALDELTEVRWVALQRTPRHFPF